MILIFTEGIFEEIRRVVYDTDVETGVTLFGRKNGEERIVTTIGSPGPNATHRYAHYSGDAEYASDVFARLRRNDPKLEWLGELHAHPASMPFLSGHDLRTVAEILLGADKETYHPDDFVAGVMLRRNGTVEIHPVHFTKSNLEGSEMELQHEYIRQEPSGTRGSLAETHRNCRSGKLRRRYCRHGRTHGRGADDGDRPGNTRD